MKLFRTITLMLVLLTAAPITVVGFVLINFSASTLKTLAQEQQLERAEHASMRISGFFQNVINELQRTLPEHRLLSINKNKLNQVLPVILENHPEFNVVTLYSLSQRNPDSPLVFDAKRVMHKEAKQFQSRLLSIDITNKPTETVFFSDPYQIERPARIDPSMGPRAETAVAVAVKLNQKKSVFLGLELSLGSLQTIVDEIRLGQQEELLLLIDRRGYLITQKSGTSANQDFPQPFPLPSNLLIDKLNPDIMQAHLSGAKTVEIENQEVLVAYAPLVEPSWLMVSLMPLNQAYVTTKKMTWQVVLLLLISTLLAVAIGIFFTFGLTRPISKCVSGALAIARGNFGYNLRIKARNEIGELAHTFNYMSRQLKYYDTKNKELVASLQKGYVETIRALANSIDAKDPYTRGHSMRVTDYALEIGKDLDLSDEELRVLSFASTLHDIGKIGIREDILTKKTFLTDQERLLMQKHPVLGEKIIEPIDFLQPVRPLVRHHHEWVDGSGYPGGLKGDRIPLGARIISTADTYDAVTSKRPYQEAMTNQQAIDILLRLRGTQLDPRVCDAMIHIIHKRMAEEQSMPQQPETSTPQPDREPITIEPSLKARTN